MAKRKIVKFTEEEKDYLMKNYPYKQTWELAEKLNVSVKKINGFAYYHKLKKASDFHNIRVDGKFDYKQADYILENFSNKTNKEIATYLGCKTSEVAAFARTHNLQKASEIYKGNSKITPKQKQFILDNYENMTNVEISMKLRLPISMIQSYAFAHGIRKSVEVVRFQNQGNLTLEQKKFIIDNYSSMNNKDICNCLGITNQQLRNYANNRKLTKNIEVAYKNDHYFEKCLEKWKDDSNKVCKIKEPLIENEALYKSKYGKYTVNQDYFEKIDNEWKAYWLGFLYADGCVTIKNQNGKMKYALSLALCSEDKAHIEKFAHSLQSNAPIKVNPTNYKDKKYVRLLITNKKICEDLSKLGCIPLKTLTLIFPKIGQVPDNLLRHFIRGYFDGDGCVHINKKKREASINFVGTLEFLTKVQQILEKECDFRPVKLQRKKNNKAYSLQYGYLRSIEKFYRYLYKDCNIMLDRKFEKFNSVFSLE